MDALQDRKRSLTFVGLSVLAHLFLMAGVYHLRLTQDFKIPDNTVFIDLNPPAPATQAAQQEKEKARQVVESEAVADAAKPKEARYLGERDQAVEEETKARQVDIFRKGGVPSKAGTGGKPSMALKSLAPSSRAFTPPTQAEIDGFRERQKQQVAPKQANAGGEAGAENAGSATNDFLKDVKEGNRTLLNTKEFVYFSYYRRIRERLEVAWNTRLRATLGDSVYGGRSIANNRNYVTGLVIVLDRNGKITAIQVMQQSGARDLDQAAIDAFNQAGPFPDPPSGLVDKNGQIKIRWDFILQS